MADYKVGDKVRIPEDGPDIKGWYEHERGAVGVITEIEENTGAVQADFSESGVDTLGKGIAWNCYVTDDVKQAYRVELVEETDDSAFLYTTPRTAGNSREISVNVRDSAVRVYVTSNKGMIADWADVSTVDIDDLITALQFAKAKVEGDI